MATITLIGAQGPDNLAYQKDEHHFFTRSPYGPDRPIDWDGDPNMYRAALLTKWDFYRVLDVAGKDLPTMDENEVALVKPEKLEDGELVYRVVEVFPFEPLTRHPSEDDPEWQRKKR